MMTLAALEMTQWLERQMAAGKKDKKIGWRMKQKWLSSLPAILLLALILTSLGGEEAAAKKAKKGSKLMQDLKNAHAEPPASKVRDDSL